MYILSWINLARNQIQFLWAKAINKFYSPQIHYKEEKKWFCVEDNLASPLEFIFLYVCGSAFLIDGRRCTLHKSIVLFVK